jgi:excisionase family DNA binding protein
LRLWEANATETTSQDVQAIKKQPAAPAPIIDVEWEPVVSGPRAEEGSAPGVSAGGLPRLAYRVSEVARMLGVSEKTVRRLIARGFFKPSKALRHLLIPRRQVEQFLERTTH